MPVSSSPASPHTCEIVLPLQRPGAGRTWKITAPFLKLALKYGVLDPWKHDPPFSLNPSVAFDTYSARRGPGAGPPNLLDFALTLEMNSRITGDHLARMDRWLALPETARELEQLRLALSTTGGLESLPDNALQLLGAFADRMIQDGERLKGIKLARTFKWLAAWAPAHVPMIDSEVHDALTGHDSSWYQKSLPLLQEFRNLVALHLDVLRYIGQRLTAEFPTCFSSPIPPVRVLDNLIWFDWSLSSRYASAFRAYLIRNDNGDCHKVTARGVAFLRKYGFRL